MKKQLINQTRIVQQAVLAGNAECKVLYNSARDMVELEVGGTSLRIAATSFFMMHEMMRKAAAKLVMQTELNVVATDVVEEPILVDAPVSNVDETDSPLYRLQLA